MPTDLSNELAEAKQRVAELEQQQSEMMGRPDWWDDYKEAHKEVYGHLGNPWMSLMTQERAVWKSFVARLRTRFNQAVTELADVKQALAFYADQFDGGEIARKVLGITKGENDGN
jgi:hypothetical protein